MGTHIGGNEHLVTANNIVAAHNQIGIPQRVESKTPAHALHVKLCLCAASAKNVFSHWEPPGVSERRRSVKLEASFQERTRP